MEEFWMASRSLAMMLGGHRSGFQKNRDFPFRARTPRGAAPRAQFRRIKKGRTKKGRTNGGTAASSHRF
jgi:hypothetical protein